MKKSRFLSFVIGSLLAVTTLAVDAVSYVTSRTADVLRGGRGQETGSTGRPVMDATSIIPPPGTPFVLDLDRACCLCWRRKAAESPSTEEKP